jgi:hypothetical protein
MDGMMPAAGLHANHSMGQMLLLLLLLLLLLSGCPRTESTTGRLEQCGIQTHDGTLPPTHLE